MVFFSDSLMNIALVRIHYVTDIHIGAHLTRWKTSLTKGTHNALPSACALSKTQEESAKFWDEPGTKSHFQGFVRIYSGNLNILTENLLGPHIFSVSLHLAGIF